MSFSYELRTRRTLVSASVLPLCLLLALSSCVQETDEVVLPDDYLCHLIPSTEVAQMLPPGLYAYDNGIASDFYYYKRNVALNGGCLVWVGGEDGPALRVSTSQHQPTDPWEEKCRETVPQLAAPRIGVLADSGGCMGQNGGGQFTVVWGFIDGGESRHDGIPPWTLVRVVIHSREGRDGYADATRVAQIILDAMDAAQAADKGGVLTAPDSTPTPQQPLPT